MLPSLLALTFDPDPYLDFQYLVSCGHDPYTCKNWSQVIQKLIWKPNRWTVRQTEVISLPSWLALSLKIIFICVSCHIVCSVIRPHVNSVFKLM